MKNFVKLGDSHTFIAPSGGVTSGSGVLIDSAFSIATTDAAVGEQFEGKMRGVYRLTKDSVTITAWSKAYWDDSAKVVTNVASGNSLIGLFTEAAATGAADVAVALNGIAI